MTEITYKSLLCSLIYIVSVVVASMIIFIVCIWIRKWQLNMEYEFAMRKKREEKEKMDKQRAVEYLKGEGYRTDLENGIVTVTITEGSVKDVFKVLQRELVDAGYAASFCVRKRGKAEE